MKIKKLALLPILIVLAAVGVFSISHPKVSADIGEMPQPGGIITPGDKTDKIQMLSEKVVYDVKKDDKNSPFYVEGSTDSWEKHYAHVKATFEMENATSSNIKMNLAFPFPCNYASLEYFTPDDKLNPAINFLVKIDGKKVNHDYAAYEMADFTPSNPTNTSDVIAVTFPVTFKADKTTTITTEYDARLVNEAKSMYASFEYIMETGSHWKGTIGTGEIIFKFDFDMIDALFKEYDDGFTLSDNQLIWKFTDLEPTSAHNIKISYAPELVKIWNSRKSYMEDISASGSAKVNLETKDFPSGYGVPMYLPWEGNPIYLLAGKDTTWEGGDDGWIVEWNATTNPWALYEFGGVYEVSGFSIKQGILTTGYKMEETPDGTHITGEEKKFYNLLSRPEKILLTFSNGTTAQHTLKDTPSKLMSVKFDKPVATSSVRVQITDVYPNAVEQTEHLGIARLTFDVGDKVEEEEEEETPPEETTQPPAKGRLEIIKKWISENGRDLAPAAVSAVIALSAGIAALILKRKQLGG